MQSRTREGRASKGGQKTSTVKARWQSGYAADCKSVDLGSTPGRASNLTESVMRH